MSKMTQLVSGYKKNPGYVTQQTWLSVHSFLNFVNDQKCALTIF